MDEIDKKLLNIMQEDFPISPEPYKELAKRLGLEEEEVMERIIAFKEKGLVRRIGGIFDPRGLGYQSTLVAVEVLPQNLKEAAERVSSYEEVTHNYQRNHRFNLWFTLIAPGQERMEEIITSVGDLPGVIRTMNLPCLRLFKIKTYFNMETMTNRDEITARRE